MTGPGDARGRRLAGRYELLEAIGSGGMAVVWRALDHRAGPGQPPEVAIKRMLPSLSGDPEFMAMFCEEARVIAALHHPHIVEVHDFLEDENGSQFIVMEWSDGLDLGWLVRAHRDAGARLPWGPLAVVGAQVLRALEAAHARRDPAGAAAPVFHRDVTPSNVLVGRNGVAKLADFGLARAMDRVTITGPGIIKGKLAYVAPELVAGRRASPQSDLFSLAVVLWEALAGRRLFEGKNDVEMFVAVGRGDVPPIAEVRDDLPEALRDALGQALEKRPERRFETAAAMAERLERVAAGAEVGVADVAALVGPTCDALAAERRRVTSRPPPRR